MSAMDEKSAQNGNPIISEDIALENADPEKIGTTTDHRDMVRMGKVQQFKVRTRRVRTLNNSDIRSATFASFPFLDLPASY
jgi:hypothetical protein